MRADWAACGAAADAILADTDPVDCRHRQARVIRGPASAAPAIFQHIRDDEPIVAPSGPSIRSANLISYSSPGGDRITLPF
jgi:hypothetical protein